MDEYGINVKEEEIFEKNKLSEKDIDELILYSGCPKLEEKINDENNYFTNLNNDDDNDKNHYEHKHQKKYNSKDEVDDELIVFGNTLENIAIKIEKTKRKEKLKYEQMKMYKEPENICGWTYDD